MFDIINTSWFALEIGYSPKWGRWGLTAYGPKHTERASNGSLRWEWRIEWSGRVHVYWRPYRPRPNGISLTSYGRYHVYIWQTQFSQEFSKLEDAITAYNREVLSIPYWRVSSSGVRRGTA